MQLFIYQKFKNFDNKCLVEIRNNILSESYSFSTFGQIVKFILLSKCQTKNCRSLRNCQ